ncbi:hypothetical protein [Acinetobacter sp. MD2(2019)]|uniref:hypothetical protein n=1 Tax=Acinetobacter sp. MD2(2019) TaxID=2605273 RepID=UPI002D77C0ED|nr:hypothetical protein [Acinetobacter sp. MD2(2019)]
MISPISYAGYNIYITKKEFYLNDGKCITKEEWNTYLKSDPTIKVDIQNSEDDFLVSLGGQEFSLWYDYNACDLLTKNPTPEAIKKMIDISKKLKATVQGEESEIYLTPNDIIKR